MPSNTTTISSTGGSVGLVSTKTYTADNAQSYAFTVATSPADIPVNMLFNVAAGLLKSIYILSDQNVTVEFNSIAGSGGTINLVAGVPYIFNTDIAAYFTNLITANVVSSFWTNASGVIANVNIELVSDPTP